MNAAATLEEPARGGRPFAAWLAASLVLHAGIVAVLVSAPERTREIFSPNNPARTITASHAEIQQVVEKVRERQANEIRDKVEELIDVQKAVAEARAQKLRDYKQAANESAAESLQKALAAEQAALAAQEEAIAAQQKTEPIVAQAVEAWTQSEQAVAAAERNERRKAFEQFSKDANAAREAIKTAQIKAGQAAGEAGTLLEFVPGDEVNAAREAQSEARKNQASADAAQDSATARAALGEQLFKLNNAQNAARQAAENLNQARQKVGQGEQALGRIEKEIASLETQLATATARAEKTKSKGDADRVTKLGEQLEKERAKADPARAAIETARAKIEPAQTSLTEKNTLLDEARRAVGEPIATLLPAQSAAQPAQAATLETQKKAVEILAQLLEQKPAAEIAAGKEESPAAQQADTPGATIEPPPGDLEKATFGELFETAVHAEKAATADFRDFRAANSAILKKTTLDDARKTTDVVQPARAKLDDAIFSKDVKTAQEAAAHTQAVRTALAELDSMVSLSRKMLETANGQASSAAGLTVSLADAGEKSEQFAALEVAALNDDAAQAKDLTGLMQSGAETQAEGATGSSATASTPGGGATTSATRSRGHTPGPVSAPNTVWPLARDGANAVPGRRVIAGGGSADWMFADSWYIIGPFPNPARRNINTAFPPESVIDLDATYAGVDDKPLRWRFVQSATAMVDPARPRDPQLAVYYAYTELWFDEEMDAWIALASDDFGKVWINGLPVWKSGTVAKAWVIDEAFRKVHFQKGINRVLFRVENCYRGTAFSFSVCTRKADLRSP